jgi:hypothetical protein
MAPLARLDVGVAVLAMREARAKLGVGPWPARGREHARMTSAAVVQPARLVTRMREGGAIGPGQQVWPQHARARGHVAARALLHGQRSGLVGSRLAGRGGRSPGRGSRPAGRGGSRAGRVAARAARVDIRGPGSARGVTRAAPAVSLAGRVVHGVRQPQRVLGGRERPRRHREHPATERRPIERFRRVAHQAHGPARAVARR